MSVKYRYIGSKEPVGGEPPYASIGAVLAPLPMLGEPVPALAASAFYPFYLPLEPDAMPRGGKAVKWWERVKTWRARLIWAGTYRSFQGGEDLVIPLTGDLTFDLFPSDKGLGPPRFNGDERDRRDPLFSAWGGHVDSALPLGPYASLGIELMQTTPIASVEIPDWLGYPAAFTGPSYYVIGEAAVAPLLILRGTIGYNGDIPQDWKITNFPRNTNDAGLPRYPGGTKQMANGVLDLQEFLLFANADTAYEGSPDDPGADGLSLDSLSLEIVPFEYWPWAGTYNAGSGNLEAASNQYED
jgi:hypothetical protein